MAPETGSRGSVALALSGGAARTIAHIGVLKVLDEAGISIGRIAGTSGGALVSVLVAAGYPLIDLEREALDIGWGRLVNFRPHPLGILSTESLGAFVRQRIGELALEELRIPCAVVATDLTVQARRVFTSGPAATAVEASCAIPEFYRPVELDGHTYIDGGVVEPLPVVTLTELQGDRPLPLVAISVLRKARHPERVKHVWQLIGQISQLSQYEMVQSLAAGADLFVQPDMRPFRFFSLDNAAGLISAGADAMRRQLPDLLRHLDQIRGEPGGGS